MWALLPQPWRSEEAHVFLLLFSNFSVKLSPSELAYVALPNFLGMTDASMTQEISPKIAASSDYT